MTEQVDPLTRGMTEHAKLEAEKRLMLSRVRRCPEPSEGWRPESDDDALDFLHSRGWLCTISHTWACPYDSPDDVDDAENAAIDYLWSEWDYGGISTFGEQHHYWERLASQIAQVHGRGETFRKRTNDELAF